MFQLTENEVELLVSQNAIPSKQHLGGYMPFVFSKYGVLQLSNVLKSEKATNIRIKIIEVFVKMCEMLTDNLVIRFEIEEIKKKLQSQDKNIELVFNYLDELIEKQSKPDPRRRIGFTTI